MVKRREFIQTMVGLTAGIMLPGCSFENKKGIERDRIGEVLPRRMLGRTGQAVTMLGLGGNHVAWASERDAQVVIETAVEGGIRFFDTAEGYGDGDSEIRYGKYLTPRYRDSIYLMTKTGAYTSKEARQHLEGSLRRMKTDYIDLWQVHAIESDADTDNRIRNGILELMLEARESGKVRHIGFTGHVHPSVHLHMLKQSGRMDFFDTCQMPVNVMDAGFHSFIDKVLPVLTERKIGILAMKTLAEGRFFREMIEDEKYRQSHDAVIPDRISLTDALYYVWSLPVSVIITGASVPEHVKDKIELARSFVKLDPGQMEELIGKVADLASFAVEEYKQIPEE